MLETDIVSERHHGMSPFTGTMLNADLRRNRIDTVVLAGVSTSIALPVRRPKRSATAIT